VLAHLIAEGCVEDRIRERGDRSLVRSLDYRGRHIQLVLAEPARLTSSEGRAALLAGLCHGSAAPASIQVHHGDRWQMLPRPASSLAADELAQHLQSRSRWGTIVHRNDIHRVLAEGLSVFTDPRHRPSRTASFAARPDCVYLVDDLELPNLPGIYELPPADTVTIGVDLAAIACRRILPDEDLHAAQLPEPDEGDGAPMERRSCREVARWAERTSLGAGSEHRTPSAALLGLGNGRTAVRGTIPATALRRAGQPTVGTATRG
jgi:hypothetical protein